MLCPHRLLFDGICHYKLQVYRSHLKPGISRTFVLYFNLLFSFCFQDLVIWLLLFFLSLYGKNDVIVSCPKEEWDLTFSSKRLMDSVPCSPNRKIGKYLVSQTSAKKTVFSQCMFKSARRNWVRVGVLRQIGSETFKSFVVVYPALIDISWNRQTQGFVNKVLAAGLLHKEEWNGSTFTTLAESHFGASKQSVHGEN